MIAVAVTVATSTLPLLPYIGSDTTLVKLCYGAWMSVLYSTFPGVYSLLAGAITDAFGPAHYQANFGLVFSITLAYFAVIVPITQVGAYNCLDYGIFIGLISGWFDLLSPWIHGFVLDRWCLWCCWYSFNLMYAIRFETSEIPKIWSWIKISYIFCIYKICCTQSNH